jgi:N-acetylglucosaminyl-diphospho-decaprenol L-rhamnosyltransferase
MPLDISSTRPELSVVIATWNSWRFLPACLSAVRAENSLNQEIIVVDNGSSDGTQSLLRDHYPSVRVVANSTNEGHSRAINRGVRLARGTYVLVLDADTVAFPGVANQLVEFMRGNPDVVIAAPKMLNGDGTVQESARRFPKPINALFGRQTFLARLFPDNGFSRHYVCRQQANTMEPFEVDWVSSACMIFPRVLVERVGFWDEGFRGYWVEADWCKQAHAVGRIYCVPRACVTHFYQNRTGKKKGVSRIIEFHYGAHRFYWKRYTRGLLDPRSILAALALTLRAAPLILVDLVRSPEIEKVQAGEFMLSSLPARRGNDHKRFFEAKRND